MFELPEAKRVRRKDLFDSDPASSSSDDDEVVEGGHSSQAKIALRAKLNAQLSDLFDFSFTAEPEAPLQQAEQQRTPPQSQARTPGAIDDAEKEEGEHPEEAAFAFRLFRDEAPTHTVVLTPHDDPAALGEGGFVVPKRPRSYYVASAPSPAQALAYRSIAVSAEYLLADAKSRRWGLEKPWRVIHISSSSSVSGSTQDGGQEEEREKKRKRPGKKHRIIVRMREKMAREREEALKKLAVEKEQHLQDKKKRLNREKKLKRRQKEREKKAQAQATNPDGGGADAATANVGDSSSREGSPHIE